MEDLTEKIEVAILTALLDELGKSGWVAVRVWDGEEYVSGAAEVMTDAEVRAAVFAVSGGPTVHFARADTPQEWGARGVMVIIGNGRDFISDYHASNQYGFSDAIDRADKRAENLQVNC